MGGHLENNCKSNNIKLYTYTMIHYMHIIRHLQGCSSEPDKSVRTSAILENISSYHMGVSWNGGTPKSSILIRFSIINHPFWGTPIFGTPHILPLPSGPSTTARNGNVSHKMSDQRAYSLVRYPSWQGPKKLPAPEAFLPFCRGKVGPNLPSIDREIRCHKADMNFVPKPHLHTSTIMS